MILLAGVTQLAERLLPKQKVVGSNPITRSTNPPSNCSQTGKSCCTERDRVTPNILWYSGMRVSEAACVKALTGKVELLS